MGVLQSISRVFNVALLYIQLKVILFTDRSTAIVLQGFVNWRYKDMATSRIWILCLVVTMHNVCVTDAKTSGARITLTSKALNYGELRTL